MIRWGWCFAVTCKMDRKHVLEEVISEWSPKESEGCGYLGEQHSRQGDRQVQRPCGRSILGELEEQHGEQRLEQAEGGVEMAGAVRQAVQAVVEVLACSLSVIRSPSENLLEAQ